MKKERVSGLTLTSTILGMAGAGALMAIAWWNGGTEPDPHPVDNPHPDLATALIRAGLDAEAMAAAGVTPGSVTSIATVVNNALHAADTSLDQIDAAYAAARVAKDTLQRKIRSGLASDQEVADYSQAKTDFESAEAARTKFLSDLFESAVAGCSAAQVGCLTKIKGNRHWSLPLQYLADDRTEQEWVDLRAALANEKISAQWEEDPDENDQALLATCNQDSDVAAAKTNLEANSAAVESAWQTSLGE